MKKLLKVALGYIGGFILFGVAIAAVQDYALLLLALTLAFFGIRRLFIKKKSANRISKGSIVLFSFSAVIFLFFLTVVSVPISNTQLANNDSNLQDSSSTKESATIASNKSNEQSSQTSEAVTAKQTESTEEKDTSETGRIPVSFVEGTDGDTFKVINTE